MHRKGEKMHKTTEHLFEIPWNNDKQLISILKDQEFLYRDKVQCIYLPCAYEHGTNTSQPDIKKWDITDAEDAINTIRDAGFVPNVLMQRGSTKENIDFYTALGVRSFTLGEDAAARYLREKYGNDVYLIASVTKDLMNEDYQIYSENDPALYDVYILRLGYNRDIECVKKLPKNLKYGIMPNITCLWRCPIQRKHWFPSLNEIYRSMPLSGYNCEVARHSNINDTAYISPDDVRHRRLRLRPA